MVRMKKKKKANLGHSLCAPFTAMVLGTIARQPPKLTVWRTTYDNAAISMSK